MLRRTFLFLPRIGATGERRLWQSGVHDWEEFLLRDGIPGIGERRAARCRVLLDRAREAYRCEDARFFASVLASVEQWRTWGLLADHAGYLDIETCARGEVTVVGVSDGDGTRQLVRGANLSKESLKRLLAPYKLLVTFNGASFDLPVLRRYYGADVLPFAAHLDLRHACRRVGLVGGLKRIERELGIRRPDEVEFTTGEDAVTLWHTFHATREEHYLKLLLTYNREDCENLELIARKVVPMLEQATLTHQAPSC